MGYKRPFDCEDFQELPFKQAKQVDYNNKMTQYANLYRTMSQETDVTDDHEMSFAKYQQHEAFEHNSAAEASYWIEDFDISAPWPLVTSSSIGDEFGSCLAAYSDFSDQSEFEFPQRSEAFDDAYSSFLDSSPRRHVPLGPNHQASIPMLCRSVNKNQLEHDASLDTSISSDMKSDVSIYDKDEEKLMGTCIIPMPDPESFVDNNDEAGAGRTDCSCVDEGSVRCVQEHIMEARERLKKSLGHDRFVSLGFYEMGEEVAQKWTKEEERVFLEVVNSYPASLGQNFWKHLSSVFSNRYSKEIVSYYFNVFMLRRRAIQNRSNFLDIDSDDDELHGVNRGPYDARVLEEDDESDIESVDQYDHPSHGEDTHDADGDDGDESDDNSDIGNGDGDIGDSSGEVTGEDSGVDNVSETHELKTSDGRTFHAVKQLDSRSRNGGEDSPVQDDSCSSFEFQADTFNSRNLVNTGVALQGSQVKNNNRECFAGNVEVYSDAGDQGYSLASCDAKPWDTHYTVPMKGVDFLPTCNIIEEIFGQGSWDDKL